MKTNAILKQAFLMLTFIGLLPLTSLAQSSRQFDTKPFTGVEASGIFTVYLTQSDEYAVFAEAEEEHISEIETRVKDGILILSFKGNARNLDKLVMYVSAPELNTFKGSGAATFRSETILEAPSIKVSGSGASGFFLELNTEQLTTAVSGATNVSYSGWATTHTISVTGASVVRAFDLETQTTTATVGGASTARLHATDYMKADVSGTSSLTYREKPLEQDFYTSGMSSINSADGDVVTTEYETDTVRVRVGEREVTVYDHGRSPQVRIKRKDRHTFKGNWGGFELGINGYMTPDNSLDMEPGYEFLDLKYERSIAVNINMFQQSFNLITNNLGLVTGLGLGWNNYRFANNVIPVHTPEGIVLGEPNPDATYRKSKLTLLYLNVPLMMEFQTRGTHASQRFHIAGGVNAGLRLRSHTKQVYDTNGNKNKDKTYEDFHVRPFRFDATARIGWGSVSLFANYSLNSLFRDDKGPELYPFTVGLRIIRW